ncbi:MAG: Uma2 family endonuclease, partial [Anaerolineae bacterium]|nr:Uma2 family endonuclease [Anaerolineae bacterium]
MFVVPPEEMERARGVPLTVRPALVVEVTSPATRGMDLGEKAAEYREAGIPEYWVVDRERQEVVAQWGS